MALSNLLGKNQRRPERDSMRFQMRKCPSCKRYTLKEDCPQCGNKTVTVHPGKYSPDDKYARYRVSDRYK